MPEVTSMVEDVVLQTEDAISPAPEPAAEATNSSPAEPSNEGEPEQGLPRCPRADCQMAGRWTSGNGTAINGLSKIRNPDQDHLTGRSARNLANSSPE